MSQHPMKAVEDGVIMQLKKRRQKHADAHRTKHEPGCAGYEDCDCFSVRVRRKDLYDLEQSALRYADMSENLKLSNAVRQAKINNLERELGLSRAANAEAMESLKNLVRICERDGKFTSHKDWACEVCAPDSNLLAKGFLCAWHKALDLAKRGGVE